MCECVCVLLFVCLQGHNIFTAGKTEKRLRHPITVTYWITSNLLLVYVCTLKFVSQSEYTQINILIVSSLVFHRVFLMSRVLFLLFASRCEWSLSSYFCSVVRSFVRLFIFYQMGWIAFEPGWCQLSDAWKNLFIDCSKECIHI